MENKADNHRDVATKSVDALDLSVLHSSETSPELLSAIGRVARDNQALPFVVALLKGIEDGDRVYDWNAAVVLSRMDCALVTEAMTCVSLGHRHLESTGLAWALGELDGSSSETVDWLERMVSESDKSKTWWRAAFSLQKLGRGDAVERLVREVMKRGLPNLEECLDDISDERATVAVLAHASVDLAARKKATESLKATYLESDDDHVLANCGWLIGRLNLVDDEILERIRELSRDESHDVRYYALYALQNSPRPAGVDIAKQALADRDPLVRRVAVRALRAIDTDESLEILRNVEAEESDDKVLVEVDCQ